MDQDQLEARRDSILKDADLLYDKLIGSVESLSTSVSYYQISVSLMRR